MQRNWRTIGERISAVEVGPDFLGRQAGRGWRKEVDDEYSCWESSSWHNGDLVDKMLPKS